MSYEYTWTPLDMTRYAYDEHGSVTLEEAYNIEVISDEEDPWGDEDPWAYRVHDKGIA